MECCDRECWYVVGWYGGLLEYWNVGMARYCYGECRIGEVLVCVCVGCL